MERIPEAELAGYLVMRGIPIVDTEQMRALYQSRVQCSLIAPLLQVPPASRGEPRCAPIRFPLLAGGTLKSAIFNIPAPLPLEKQNTHRVSLTL